jgi:hypothetical protein
MTKKQANSHATDDEAAAAYSKAAKERYGEFARSV